MSETRYITIASSDAVEFGKSVNLHLEMGWELQGGVSISMQTESIVKYAQALVKEINQDA